MIEQEDHAEKNKQEERGFLERRKGWKKWFMAQFKGDLRGALYRHQNIMFIHPALFYRILYVSCKNCLLLQI